MPISGLHGQGRTDDVVYLEATLRWIRHRGWQCGVVGSLLSARTACPMHIIDEVKSKLVLRKAVPRSIDDQSHKGEQNSRGSAVYWCTFNYRIPTPTAVSGWKFPFVCFPHDISKTDTARITKPDTNVPRWVLETRLFWDHEVKDQGHMSRKHYRRRYLHSCERWLLLIFRCIHVSWLLFTWL